MSLPSAEVIAKVQEWRRKAADGTITLEEQKEAILFLRANRFAAQSAPKTAGGTKKSSTKKPIKSGDDLLSELDALG